MSIIIKIFLIFIFNIFILHQSFALNLDLKFHKETINNYCDFLYNKKDNLFSSDHWRVEEVNNIREYFHLSSEIKIKIFPFIPMLIMGNFFSSYLKLECIKNFGF